MISQFAVSLTKRESVGTFFPAISGVKFFKRKKKASFFLSCFLVICG